MMMSLTAACASIDAPPDGCGWVKPISVAEEDRLTTATKRALLAHNEAPSGQNSANRVVGLITLN